MSQRSIDAILDDPRLSDLYEEDGTPVEPGNFVLRVGILFANGVVTAGEARALVAPYGSAASSLGHLPDEYRCHPRRPPMSIERIPTSTRPCLLCDETDCISFGDDIPAGITVSQWCAENGWSTAFIGARQTKRSHFCPEHKEMGR